MKITALTIFFLSSSLLYGQNTLLQDIDFDTKEDRVYLDSSNRIVCELSTNKYQQIYSEPINSGGNDRIVGLSEGFAFISSDKRASHVSRFHYDKKSNQILLDSIESTNITYTPNDDNSCDSLNLLTNTFTADFKYFDENEQRLVSLPFVYESVSFPKVSLSQYGNLVYKNYQSLRDKYYQNDIKKYTLHKSPEEIEIILLNKFSELEQQLKNDSDSIEDVSEQLSQEIIDLISSNPETLEYDFKKLVNTLKIITSDDKKLRFYSWDTQTGGSMHFYKNIIQYQTENGVQTHVPETKEDDPQSYCSAIYTVKIKQQPQYLVITNGVYSSSDLRQSVLAYTISNTGKLEDASIFKTKSKTMNHKIDVDFDFFSVVDRPERPLKLITYNKQTGILTLPLVDGKNVTSKNINYRFNGKYLEYYGIR
ncbi:MAG: hypothetical protein PHQ90_06275 [Sulfuricurvum sp.]|uniref:hypothetical protein n=1 Tax=Sulfuricurvum sp. TaxID=2025608 RepID=UPI00260BD72C|nr:hypothetical protein [Sulfuricurvum sp.]MDD2368891.1 hypothetical protein [Sulfuricurvum sp.]MDD5118116.1 hypothetical protein [Sulfuricurvum sp.]